MSNVAFIPAKSTSQRLSHKNVRLFFGHPLMAYTISAALRSGVFDDVYVVCRDARYKAIAKRYGAKVFERSASTEQPKSRDFDWLFEALAWLHLEGHKYDSFAILRPTSPFRTSATIQRAWNEFPTGADSLRAVEPVRETPYKMWWIRHGWMYPVMPQDEKKPEHSSQSQYLPQVWKQNASLEMAWTDTVWDTKTIAGSLIHPFKTIGYEGVDINTWDDWRYATQLVDSGKARLEI